MLVHRVPACEHKKTELGSKVTLVGHTSTMVTVENGVNELELGTSAGGVPSRVASVPES
jgi:hypothetical protein